MTGHGLLATAKSFLFEAIFHNSVLSTKSDHRDPLSTPSYLNSYCNISKSKKNNMFVI